MSNSAADVEKDSILESFISLARQDETLKDEIKAALNQDQVIAIAAARGYVFDSLTILRRWSKHNDFSQDTWLGWFSE
ncbi:Nif11-like leader peptide family natural product precursor [Synechococcus sp. MIT S1220]|uniref:Nif11-like leader peptide family natural product precursor n=1 Tax=Synechococcus sp. MIT S1220 TaxID=3082549 RepID=UPI0039B12079